MNETGPIYGVELIDSLPLNYKQTSGMRQAMPSRADLESVKRCKGGGRIRGGYEVLLNHWREQAAKIERLRAIQDAAWNYMYACEQSRGEAVELLALSEALEKAVEAKEKNDGRI